MSLCGGEVSPEEFAAVPIHYADRANNIGWNEQEVKSYL